MNNASSPYDKVLTGLDEINSHVQYSEKGHRYLIDGASFPSVTTILNVLDKPGLDRWRVNQERELCKRIALRIEKGEIKRPEGIDFEPWFERMLGKEQEHERISKEAKNIGSEVHLLIQGWVQRLLHLPQVEVNVPPSDKAIALFGAFLGWAEQVDGNRNPRVRPIATETKVFSKKHRYAGRLDLLAFVEGVKTVIDFKSSKSYEDKAWDEEIAQSEAYRAALEEHGLGQWAGLILKLPKDGSPVCPVPVGDNPGRRGQFFALCQAHWALKEAS